MMTGKKAWGESTGMLTKAEHAALRALGCTYNGAKRRWNACDGTALPSMRLPEGRGFARWLIRRGIKPLGATCKAEVVSIGTDAMHRWYGWSHRVAESFGVGDMLFDAALIRSGGVRESDGKPWDLVPFRECGTQRITLEADAKNAAIRFAKYAA